MNSTQESSANTEDITLLTVRNVSQSQDSGTDPNQDINIEQQSIKAATSSSDLNEAASSLPLAPNNNINNNINNNNNTSLIIIDTDELNSNNETQIIQKIIDEYERRLQEQLALAREDIVHELEQQIQVSLKRGG